MPNQFTKEDTRYRKESTLREMYWEEEMTMGEMSEHLGVHKSTIYNWMEKHGIERREPQQQRYRFYKLPSLVTKPPGYQVWQTQWRNERYAVPVHRLVAVAEYGFDAIEGKQVHHKNGVAWDNRPENIELLSPSEHQHRHPENQKKGGEALIYSDQELLEYIIEWYEENGEMPTSDEFESDDDVPSVKTYLDRFESWTVAKEQAIQES